MLWAEKAFSFSPQVLVEKSLKGWKEVEYEVVRDPLSITASLYVTWRTFRPAGYPYRRVYRDRPFADPDQYRVS